MASFNSLPYELRSKIWLLALPIDRKVLYPYPATNSKNGNPVLLFVNRESRQLTQKYYTTLSPNSQSQNKIHYVDWKNDIFEFPMGLRSTRRYPHRDTWSLEFETGGVEDIVTEEMGKMQQVEINRTLVREPDNDQSGCALVKVVSELGAVNLREVIFKTHVGLRYLLERENAGIEGEIEGDEGVSEEMRKKGEVMERWFSDSLVHELRRGKGCVGWQSPRVTLKGCDVGCVSCGSRVRYYKARKSTRDHRRKLVKERVAKKREESKRGEADSS